LNTIFAAIKNHGVSYNNEERERATRIYYLSHIT